MVEADKKEGRPFMEQVFTPVWNGPYYNAAQRGRIVDVSNYMLKKRFEAFPHFRDYLGAIAELSLRIATPRGDAAIVRERHGMEAIHAEGLPALLRVRGAQ